MDIQALADKIIQQATTGQDDFVMPEMDDSQFILWVDSLRIPEFMADMNGHSSLLTDPSYKQRYEQYQTLLGLLRRGYELGFVSADDYQRLTMPQDYTPDQRENLRNAVDHFMPRWSGVASNGEKVYVMLDGDGQQFHLTHEGGRWIRHAGYPYSVFDR